MYAGRVILIMDLIITFVVAFALGFGAGYASESLVCAAVATTTLIQRFDRLFRHSAETICERDDS